MSLVEVIHNSAYAAHIRESQYIYPLMQCVHITGLAMFAGGVALVNVRVAGLGSAVPLVDLGRHAMRVAWIGLAMIVLTGVNMAASFLEVFAVSTVMQVKLGFILLALANAVIIACYTLVDGRGVRVAGDALAYVMVLFVLDGLPYPALVLATRGAQGRREILRYARGRWPIATLGGAASIGSYAIALWAMTHAPVASVAALRETSVLFAAVLGVWLLKERFGLQRALGTLVLVAGVIALRMG